MNITSEDVEKMRKVADCFTSGPLTPFIAFTKLGEFSREEINFCKKAQGKYQQRVILLSLRELEPYRIYEKTGSEFDINPFASQLEDLAQVTQDVYFNPKPR